MYNNFPQNAISRIKLGEGGCGTGDGVKNHSALRAAPLNEVVVGFPRENEYLFRGHEPYSGFFLW